MKKQTPIYDIAKQQNADFSEQDGWQVVQKYGDVAAETAPSAKLRAGVSTTTVALCDQSHRVKIRIEGKTAGAMLGADELAVNVGKPFGDGWVYRLRRDLFFASGAAAETATSAALSAGVTLTQQAANSPDLITVTDVTHGNSELWLVGPHSAELLSRLCGLDFDDRVFPSGVAKQSSVAKTTQIIIRRDLGDIRMYALIGGRSLAAYLWQTILEAGQDLSVQPIGLGALK